MGDNDYETALYLAIEAVVVGRFKVTALGLSDAITDAVLAFEEDNP
jgi:hypothetical protein